MGIDSSGYNPIDQEQFTEELRTLFKKYFGEDIEVDKQGTPANAIFLSLRELGLLNDEQLGQVWSELDIETATGENLDTLLELRGIQRIDSTQATVELTFNGVDGTILPQGFLVSAPNFNQETFQTLDSVEIQGEIALVSAQAVNTGSQGNLEIGTITNIVNPLQGVNGVVNNTEAFGGGDQETDDELRDRAINNPIKIGTENTVIQSLFRISGVTKVIVRENTTLDFIEEDIPPLSVAFVIVGGTNQEIGNVLFNTTAIPFRTFGDQEIAILNNAGKEIFYYFNRPISSNIDIQATFYLSDKTNLPSDVFTTAFEVELKEIIASFQIGETISGSDCLVLISKEFWNNNFDVFKHTIKIELRLKKETDSFYSDTLIQNWKEEALLRIVDYVII